MRRGAACCALLISMCYKLSSVKGLIWVARSVCEIEFCNSLFNPWRATPIQLSRTTPKGSTNHDPFASVAVHQIPHRLQLMMRLVASLVDPFRVRTRLWGSPLPWVETHGYSWSAPSGQLFRFTPRSISYALLLSAESSPASKSMGHKPGVQRHTYG